MAFEEKIAHSLRTNSKWQGSADLLWAEIQSQLEKKTPWWRKQQLWLGTVVAVTIIMAFFIQNVLTPLPPGPVEPELALQPKAFSVQFIIEEPLTVVPGDEISLAFDLLPVDTSVAISPTLIITELGEGSGILFQETPLSATDVHARNLTVLAPSKPGLYRLAVHGTIVQGEQVYTIHGQREIVVQDEKGR